jgi:hypothetical protein
LGKLRVSEVVGARSDIVCHPDQTDEYPMSRSGILNHSPLLGTQPISAVVGKYIRSPGFPLPLFGALSFAGIRVLSLAIAAFLLPRGKFHELHYSLKHLIMSWDSNRYQIIAVHGYSYESGNLHHDSIFAWFPGYPAAIDTISWIPEGLCETLFEEVQADCSAE